MRRPQQSKARTTARYYMHQRTTYDAHQNATHARKQHTQHMCTHMHTLAAPMHTHANTPSRPTYMFSTAAELGDSKRYVRDQDVSSQYQRRLLQEQLLQAPSSLVRAPDNAQGVIKVATPTRSRPDIHEHNTHSQTHTHTHSLAHTTAGLIEVVQQTCKRHD